MITIRNRQGLIEALNNKQAFNYGNHLRAGLTGDSSYQVADYSTLLLVIDKDNKIVYFDNSFYSVTTSRTQNLLKGVFNIVAPERKAYLFDTEPKRAYLGGIYGEVSFSKEGLILFASIGQIGSKGSRFYSPKSLSPLLSLYIGGTWCEIETKLLRGEE